MPFCDVVSAQSRKALLDMAQIGSAALASTLDPRTGPRNERRIRRKEFKRIGENVLNSGILSKHMSETINHFGVLCLSSEGDNHLMWAHYADKHRGILFELDLDSLFPLGSSNDGTLTRHLFPIEYSHLRPILSFHNPGKPALLTKGIEWEYEKEWRVMFHIPQLHRDIINNKEVFFTDLPPLNIRKVFLGCNISDADAQRIKGILSDSRFAHIELFKKRLHPKEFRLDDERLKG